MKKKVNLIGWFSYNDIDCVFPELQKLPMLKDSPIYQEAEYDEIHKETIIQDIIKHNYVIYGDTHQSDKHDCIPVFEDGYIFLSMRTWGALMAEAQNIKENTDKYTYLDFYMVSVGKLDEHLPN